MLIVRHKPLHRTRTNTFLTEFPYRIYFVSRAESGRFFGAVEYRSRWDPFTLAVEYRSRWDPFTLAVEYRSRWDPFTMAVEYRSRWDPFTLAVEYRSRWDPFTLAPQYFALGPSFHSIPGMVSQSYFAHGQLNKF